MKKTIFTLSALLTITLATAQSYPKQPDPKVYNVIRHSDKEEATEAEEQKEAVATTDIEVRRKDQEDLNTEVTETQNGNPNGLADNDNQ